ncbi:hypothetical protein [Actinocorallia sp. A-T 12471]|uniref:hypothetical protein n=1 Tax=Actinocorallia sp. A-T 12471 TaxID=3089813 RepID=UPI0029D38C56|nr:hypothetical protein [Actinocorallia sp. A-T 12471]MDX6739338.1 hypothetical protein [Actinocorallia sp. A-T 12471]
MAKATEGALEAALRMVEEMPQSAGAWVDHWHREDGGSEVDPLRLVLNVRFTGDLEVNERRVREVWGGALCVSAARYTMTELIEVTERVIKEFPQVRSSWPDVVANRVGVLVFVATPEFQAELDARYGVGMVRATGEARPVD